MPKKRTKQRVDQVMLEASDAWDVGFQGRDDKVYCDSKHLHAGVAVGSSPSPDLSLP